MPENSFAIAQPLNRRFPQGGEPFQIMTGLLDQCGVRAQPVNPFQDAGIKRVKSGRQTKPNLQSKRRM